MKKSRKLDPSPARLAALGPNQWGQLMRKVIAQAQATNDPRLATLQQAVREGTVEKVLRRMSVICDADIRREFPDQST